MKNYVIEREIPGAGSMSPAELKDAARLSNAVLQKLGPGVQWVQSHVTGDKLYCVYRATSEALILEHARLSGFPANRVTPVHSVISPATADS